MKKTTSVKWGSLKVGMLLTFAVAVMLWASLSGAGTSIFDSKGKIVCYFGNVSGLVSGAPVWMAGVEVGNVKSIKFVSLDERRRVEVVCRVKKSVWPLMTADTKVQLGTIGFLGDKYVEILPGTVGLPVIEEMAIVETTDPSDAAMLFEAGKEAFTEAGSLVANMDAFLGRMNRGEGTLGRLATDQDLYTNMTALLTNLAQLTADLQQNQERIVSSLEKTAGALDNLSRQVTDSEGSVHKLLTDPALYDNLARASGHLDSILTKINQAEGSTGLFVNDTAMYTEIVDLMARVNNLISDIQANPRKYFKFSVF